ncbi:protein of unknown function [Xenorhabdus poinarii G6]|uniref:Uncharacterized protein n=1 Tax=Xenorhabdus poinarii G6 TaxID=1354304 RepID=A0A068R169_9GAMM|nr:protein of unknown function [Xenorhabdus poinarii G6]
MQGAFFKYCFSPQSPDSGQNSAAISSVQQLTSGAFGRANC